MTIRMHIVATLLVAGAPHAATAQRAATPIRQSTPRAETTAVKASTLRDASRNDRWLGLGVRDVRWAPDGSVVYFRWHENPRPDDVSEADPWFKAGRNGRWTEKVTDPAEARSIPSAGLAWSPNRRLAVWSTGSSVFLNKEGRTRAVVRLGPDIDAARFSGADAIDITSDESLYRYTIADGSLVLMASRVTIDTRRVVRRSPPRGGAVR